MLRISKKGETVKDALVSGQMSIFNTIFCATRFCVSLFRPIVPLQFNWRAPWSGLARVTALPPSLSLQHNTPPYNYSEKRPAVRTAVTPGSRPLTQNLRPAPVWSNSRGAGETLRGMGGKGEESEILCFKRLCLSTVMKTQITLQQRDLPSSYPNVVRPVVFLPSRPYWVRLREQVFSKREFFVLYPQIYVRVKKLIHDG